jgi:hypothetical protein
MRDRFLEMSSPKNRESMRSLVVCDFKHQVIGDTIAQSIVDVPSFHLYVFFGVLAAL